MASKPPAIFLREPTLDVPEEPEKEDDENLFSEGFPPSGSVIQFMTAVKIARWMARAYGYVARKRKSYLEETMITTNRLTAEELQHARSSKKSLGLVSRQNSFFDFDLKKDKEPDISMIEAQDQAKNMEKICRWFASSYGETSKEYHEAYSRELIRQIKMQTMMLDPEGNPLKKPVAWF